MCVWHMSHLPPGVGGVGTPGAVWWGWEGQLAQGMVSPPTMWVHCQGWGTTKGIQPKEEGKVLCPMWQKVVPRQGNVWGKGVCVAGVVWEGKGRWKGMCVVGKWVMYVTV